jgi:2-oxo-3-hexenedioate decarboxylase/2-keto-4-pentenoate hydratase
MRQEDAAPLLRMAEATRAPIDPIRLSVPDLDVEGAYAIQQLNLEYRLGAGETLAGRKIGLTSRPMQQLLGVDEPDYGYLLSSMLFESGATLDRDAFCAPRVEPEVAFRLHTTLRGPNVTAHDVLAATEAVAPALEVVDSRVRDWDITLVDTIADNASSAAVVLGEWVPFDQAPRPAGIIADLVVNGDVVDSGTGAAVLGDPAVAIAWLANALAPFGVALEPDQVLMPGSFTSAVFVHSGDKAEARFAGLGDVSVTFG